MKSFIKNNLLKYLIIKIIYLLKHFIKEKTKIKKAKKEKHTKGKTMDSKSQEIEKNSKLIKEPYKKDAREIIELLHSSENGLSEEEAKKRLEKYGKNTLAREKKISKISLFLNEFKSTLIIILIIAAIISFVIGIYHNTDDWLDGIVILIIVFFNAIFGFIQNYKSEQAIAALRKLTSLKATVIRDGKAKEINSSDVTIGDILLVSEGDKVAADALLIESNDLKVDESSLTGESLPVNKKAMKLNKTVSIGDIKNMIFSSTNVLQGNGKAIVVATGKMTEIGKISQLISDIDNNMTPLQKRLDKFGKRLSYFILLICVVIFFVMMSNNFSIEHIDDSLLVAISLAVAAIPEGLPAVVTISLALGVKALVKKNALVRKLPAVESLGSTSIICTDKTGTLTKNSMTVLKYVVDDKIIDIVKDENKELKNINEKDRKLLFTIGLICNNAKIGKDSKPIGDPTEVALIYPAKRLNIKEENFTRIKEIPFNSERKMMTVVVAEKNNTLKSNKPTYYAFSKGAPDIILSKCNYVLKNNRIIKLTSSEKKKILELNNTLAKQAYRVLGFAYQKLDSKIVNKILNKNKKVKNSTVLNNINDNKIENNLIFVGLEGMIDPLRENVIESFKQCQSAGIDVAMITGDYPLTAQAIAKQIGLKNAVISGQELEKAKEEGKFRETVLSHRIFARVAPEQKLDIVKIFQNEREIVAMTGDGVNDAPALKKADIGIAMGQNGTEVAKEASDMILTDNSFSSIVKAVFEGRRIYDNIKKFITYMLSTNIAEVLIILIAILINKGQSPLTAIQLLWINLLTDGFPALALGVDPARKDIMKEKPRDPKENILNREFITSMLGIGSLITFGVLLLYELYSFGVKISPIFVSAKADTIAFTSLVLFELIILKYVRDKYKQPFFSNKWLTIAIALSVGLQLLVVYVPLFNIIFKTVPLNLEDWGIMLVTIILLYGLLEMYNLIYNSYKKNSHKKGKGY